MIKTILALIGLCALVFWLLGAQPVECEGCILVGTPCYSNGGCVGDCICILPEGPGSKGWCN